MQGHGLLQSWVGECVQGANPTMVTCAVVAARAWCRAGARAARAPASCGGQMRGGGRLP